MDSAVFLRRQQTIDEFVYMLSADQKYWKIDFSFRVGINCEIWYHWHRRHRQWWRAFFFSISRPTDSSTLSKNSTISNSSPRTHLLHILVSMTNSITIPKFLPNWNSRAGVRKDVFTFPNTRTAFIFILKIFTHFKFPRSHLIVLSFPSVIKKYLSHLSLPTADFK